MASWMDQIGSLLQQYGGGQQQPARPVEDDFDQVAGVAPKQAMAGGLSDAFRSPDTAPFPNMVGQLFGQSNGNQRADLLNMLMSSVGPALLSSALSGRSSSSNLGGLGNLGGLAGLLGGNQGQITPEQAAQVPPEAMEEVARQAETQDPGIIDRISDFYAEHPTLVKGLGAAALAIAMQGMTKQRR